MATLHHLAIAAALALPLAAPAQSARAGHAVAADGQIYQQRLADGRVVLTDRPVGGAQTQRTWQISREDPVAAYRRSEQVRLEAQVVAERIQRRLDREQLRDIEADRLRANLAEARLEAEDARDNAGDTGVLFAPAAFSRFGRHGRSRLGSGHGPHPGAPGFGSGAVHPRPWRQAGSS